MNFGGLNDDIIKMLAGGRVKVDTTKFQNDMAIIQSKDDVLTVLIHLGYLSFNKAANAAIDQIKRKQYPAKIEQYAGNLLLVCISYDRETRTHECRIEKA